MCGLLWKALPSFSALAWTVMVYTPGLLNTQLACSWVGCLTVMVPGRVVESPSSKERTSPRVPWENRLTVPGPLTSRTLILTSLKPLRLTSKVSQPGHSSPDFWVNGNT